MLLAADGWQSKDIAVALGVGCYRRKNGLKPLLVCTFKVSRDPKFVDKLEDIVGLYLSPPEHALVLFGDEKSLAPALDPSSRDCRHRKDARPP